MKHKLLQLDTLDDRREVFTLLSKLSPRLRIDFIDILCLNLATSISIPRVLQSTRNLAEQAMKDDAADHKLTLDLFFDFWGLIGQHGIDPEKAVNLLTEMIKKPEVARCILPAPKENAYIPIVSTG